VNVTSQRRRLDRVRPALSPVRGAGPASRLGQLRVLAGEPARHTAPGARSLETGARRPFVAAVVGPPGSGKTSLLHAAVERLRAGGARVGGVTQPAVHAGEERTGYRLRDVATGEEVEFARRAERGFDFTDEGWRWSHERLCRALESADVVVIDELGRLEAQGGGHLRQLVVEPRGEHPAALLVAVREECAGDVAARVGPFDVTVRPGAASEGVEELVGALRAALRAGALAPPDEEQER
jgi:nucleoside-triphosphatase THEP1